MLRLVLAAFALRSGVSLLDLLVVFVGFFTRDPAGFNRTFDTALDGIPVGLPGLLV